MKLVGFIRAEIGAKSKRQSTVEARIRGEQADMSR